jgi:hypothetical protein
MTFNLYAFTCGTVIGEFAHLMEDGEDDITVPIPVFLIEYSKGTVLFSPLDGLVNGSPGYSVSAFSPAKR